MSAIITKYLGQLKGIEVGRGIHNNFHLNAINVDSPYGHEFDVEQTRYGSPVPAVVDIVADATTIPLEDSSSDYVFSSHVFEHLVNPIAALKEWYRLVRNEGYIAIIIPLRHVCDAGRPITSLDEMKKLYINPQPQCSVCSHVTVWDMQSLKGLVLYGNTENLWNLTEVECQEKDDQVGNGFLLILKVNK